jgi:hypothetical protein
MVNTERELVQDGVEALRHVLSEVGKIEVVREPDDSRFCDVVLLAKSAEAEFRIGVEARSRITPQTALSVAARMWPLRQHTPEVIPVVYAPVISPRVAAILQQHNVGYIDQAGNCRLRSARHRVLIDRRGYTSAARAMKSVGDPFSPKSSRIVRAMLSQPKKGWGVRELAEHPDVAVSVGLVAKVKQALIEEAYAIERGRVLNLRDSFGLLENWAQRYPGPAEQVPLYFRGDAEAAEEAVAQWCRDNGIPYALAGFSAAWRWAPEVRYNVAAVYVDNRGWDRTLLDKLADYRGGKPVESGANLLLWRPFDRSVLAGVGAAGTSGVPVTSAIQTFLDLKTLAGRGEEAAKAVYQRQLEPFLREAAEWVQEMQRD